MTRKPESSIRKPQGRLTPEIRGFFNYVKFIAVLGIFSVHLYDIYSGEGTVKFKQAQFLGPSRPVPVWRDAFRSVHYPERIRQTLQISCSQDSSRGFLNYYNQRNTFPIVISATFIVNPR